MRLKLFVKFDEQGLVEHLCRNRHGNWGGMQFTTPLNPKKACPRSAASARGKDLLNKEKADSN